MTETGEGDDPGGAGRLSLAAIEAFVAVAEAGFIAEAARRMGTSASALSQRIANLETALGAALLDRSARPLALTPAGRVFRMRAVAILDETARARAELAELALTHLPELRIAAIEDFDDSLIPALAARLGARMPRCRIMAATGPSHRNHADLMERRADIAIGAEIEDAPDWIERHPLIREPFLLVTAPGLISAGREPLPALMAAPMVRYTATQLMQRQIGAQLSRLRLSPALGPEFDSNRSVMAMVRALGGWTVTTPLGALSGGAMEGGSDAPALDLHPLPFAGFGRTLALHARRGVLGGLPAEAAAMLREDLRRVAFDRIEAAAPWLAGEIGAL